MHDLEFLKSKLPSLKECVSGDVTFQFYRKGNLYYKCDNSFIFPVPIEDAGDGTFLLRDRALLFMRWIRKELQSHEEENRPK